MSFELPWVSASDWPYRYMKHNPTTFVRVNSQYWAKYMNLLSDKRVTQSLKGNAPWGNPLATGWLCWLKFIRLHDS